MPLSREHFPGRKQNSPNNSPIQILVMGQKSLEESLVQPDLSVATTLGHQGSLDEITPGLHIQMNQAGKGLPQDLIVGQVFDQDQAFHLAGRTTASDTTDAAGAKSVDTAQTLDDQNLLGTEVSDQFQPHRWSETQSE